MTPAPGMPWWLEEAPQDPAAPLRSEVYADVVVGGGYTGLWTTLALRERKPELRVVVLERNLCGRGPSGRNGGFLHGYWSRLPKLRVLFGDGGALAVARAAEGALDAVEALDEDVWLPARRVLKVATAPAQEAALDDFIAAVRALGVDEEAVPLSRDEVAQRCSSPLFRRGVLVRHCATVQPARLVRALRRRALAAGVELHEGTRATAVDDGVVATDGGRVRGRWAARAPADQLRQLRRSH